MQYYLPELVNRHRVWWWTWLMFFCLAWNPKYPLARSPYYCLVSFTFIKALQLSMTLFALSDHRLNRALLAKTQTACCMFTDQAAAAHTACACDCRGSGHGYPTRVIHDVKLSLQQITLHSWTPEAVCTVVLMPQKQKLLGLHPFLCIKNARVPSINTTWNCFIWGPGQTPQSRSCREHRVHDLHPLTAYRDAAAVNVKLDLSTSYCPLWCWDILPPFLFSTMEVCDLYCTESHRYISRQTLSSIIGQLPLYGNLRTQCPWDWKYYWKAAQRRQLNSISLLILLSILSLFLSVLDHCGPLFP